MTGNNIGIKNSSHSLLAPEVMRYKLMKMNLLHKIIVFFYFLKIYSLLSGINISI